MPLSGRYCFDPYCPTARPQARVAAQEAIPLQPSPHGALADGCLSDPAVAGRLADDLLAAHKAHLPQFA
jgi:hypothetical protein